MKRKRKARQRSRLTMLTNDPSMTAWGWAVVSVDGSVFDAGCIKTEPSKKTLRIRKSDDRMRRLSEIVQILGHQIVEYRVDLLLAELPSGSKSANAAFMNGAVSGVLQTIATFAGLPIEWYSEGDAKKNLLNKRAASKQEIIDRVKGLYDFHWPHVKYKDEAIADALAIHHLAKRESSIIKFAINSGQKFTT